VEEVGDPSMTTGIKTLWIRKHSSLKQKKINDNQKPVEGQAVSAVINIETQ
jgi:hypothetical protein